MRSEVLGLATINTAGRNNSCSGVGVDSAQGAVRKQGRGMIIIVGKLNYMPLKMRMR